MKPCPHRIEGLPQHSFVARHQIEPFFGLDWHYHRELELHYLIKGQGVRFIGDNISSFTEGELILLGSNLPHFWKSNEEYLQGSSLYCEAIVIQFLPETFGKDFLNLPEIYIIRQLYERAKNGLFITGETKNLVVQLMEKILDAKYLGRFTLLLEILHLLARDESPRQISGFNQFASIPEADTARLNEIYDFTLTNYKRNISLGEVAAVANLSVTSFCRYFKRMTKKTYNDFLTEIRISHASRKLLDNGSKVEIVAFDCGFNNLSNFYKQFKKVKGITPREYKWKFFAE